MRTATALLLAFIVGGTGWVLSAQDDIAQARTSAVDSQLRSTLPYYQQDPPEWCVEDMACWIGTTADGRTPDEIFRDLPADLAYSDAAYGTDTLLPPHE